jgi:hypothetical protein
MVHDALAIMLSVTTHGTSLSDEERQCVEHDVILPARPVRETVHPGRAGPPALLFSHGELHFVGKLIGTALREKLGLHLWALAVQVWYAHLVVATTAEPVDRIVRCAEDAVREGLGLKRPIWEPGYDKRFCFDEETAAQWIAYVERHNRAIGLPPKPWSFIETPSIQGGPA